MRHILLFLLPLSLFANLEVGVVETQSVGNKGLVKVALANKFDQPIKSARIWVVLLDDDGKIVGQNAQWLVGRDKDGKALKDGQLNLAPHDESQTDADGNPPKLAEFSIAVDAKREFAHPKVTFSRIVLADGTLADPQTSLRPLGESKE